MFKKKTITAPRWAGMRLPTSVCVLTLMLAACHDGDDGKSETAPTGSLTVQPSLGKIQNADVILRQLSSGRVLGTLNTGSGDSVSFDKLALDLGAYEAEVRATASSTYFDEAVGAFVPFSGSLHVAGQYSGAASVAVTALTEAAYQRAKTLGPALTAANIAQANSEISQLFGIDITAAPRVVASVVDMSQLQAHPADAYALVLAAIAEAAEAALGSSEVAPALKAAFALAADAADGRIDGLANGMVLAGPLPYQVDGGGGYAQQLQGFIDSLIAALGLPADIARQINLPASPDEPVDPVDPPVTPPSGTTSAGGSIVTGNTVSPEFSPKSDGFMVAVDEEGVRYEFKNSKPSGSIAYTHGVQIVAGVGGAVMQVVYSDTRDLGLSTTIVCGDAFKKPCQGITVTPDLAARSVSIAFADAPMTQRDGATLGAQTLFNGTLTAAMPAAAAMAVGELPRATDGLINVNGVNELVRTTRVGVSSAPIPSGVYTVTTIDMRTDSGKFTVTRNTTTPSSGTPSETAELVYQKAGLSGLDALWACNNCASALAVSTSPGYGVIRLSDVLLKNYGSGADLTLKNTIGIGGTSGSLSSSSAGSFNPAESSVYSSDDLLTYRFASAIDTVSADTITSVSLSFRGNTLAQVSATTRGSNGAGGKLYTCFDQAQPILGTPACGSGIVVSQNRRSLTLTDIHLSSGKTGGELPLSLSGTLVNAGL